MPAAAKVLHLADRRTRNREAVKRHRARERKNQALATVTIDASVLDMLVATGWLTDAEASDMTLVGRAISEMLKDAAKRS
jgi:hypothetical protein